MRITATISVFLMAGLLAGCAGDGRFKSFKAALEGASVTLADAMQTALGEVDGRIVEAELDPDGTPVFEVELLSADGAIEVRIDPATGEVQSVDAIGESYSSCETIPFEDAVQIAEDRVNGEAVAIRQEDCELEIHVMTSGTLWEVELAPDGRFREKEEADDDEDEWD